MSAQIPNKPFQSESKKARNNKQCAKIGKICSKHFEKPEQSRN